MKFPPSDSDSTQVDSRRNHVLIISHEIVGAQMAGPGIRYYNLARVLSQEFEVVLAIPCNDTPKFQKNDFQLVEYKRGNWESIERFAKTARAIVIPSDTASEFPQLAQCEVPLVIDGYTPLLAEWLVQSQSNSAEINSRWWSRMLNLSRQYLVGDFFICASERQRDWWLGLLEANGRINPWTFQEDPTLRRLIDVVPFGLPENPPQHSRKQVKGVWLGIGENDRVALWGGGLWPWLDPLTAIRSIAKISQHRQDVKLIFPGTQHPNPSLAGIPTHNSAARALANQLGLLDQTVFFGDWVAFEDWPNVLLESDVAISLHFGDTLETRLAFRSRVLDYIWASLPIVATRGDAISEFVAAHELGMVVNSQDVDGVADAILNLLDISREAHRARIEHVRELLTWQQAARPLIEFCRQPRRAPDKIALGERLGNPLSVDEIRQLRAENGQLRKQVNAYERRLAVRLANRVPRVRKKQR